MKLQPLELITDDGLRLEGERLVPEATRSVGVVLCHPHPQYGGTMRSLVTSVLFDELPARGFTTLRFNFRGVEGSEGSFDNGNGETHDVIAALDSMRAGGFERVALIGWSFGADMALSVTDARIAGWVAIAPPLRFRTQFGAADDPRPKHLVLAAHDEVRPPHEIEAIVASWPAATSEVVAGASHFFVGRTDRVVAAAQRFLLKLT